MDKDFEEILKTKLDGLNEKEIPGSKWDKESTWKKIQPANQFIVPVWLRYAAAAVVLLFLLNYFALRPYNETICELVKTENKLKDLKQKNYQLQQELLMKEEIHLASKSVKKEKPIHIEDQKQITKIVYQIKYDTVFIKDTLVKIVYENPVIDEIPGTDSLEIPVDYSFENLMPDSSQNEKVLETIFSVQEPGRKIGFTFLKRRKVMQPTPTDEKKLLCLRLYK
ncbi:MAG: hypothetical protein K9H64_11225 [Bacteroidales bacterium]|nr:hypothetical protein [Bacteroidales bacterium]MCF8456522.1 hypothetical protein [Bacteroidales bacterium]